jgi:hypothetical protein
VPDGFRRGAPFGLYDFQLRYIRNFYLVRADARWVPERPIRGPAFVYQRGLLVGPQGIGKNPLIAAQVCLEGVGPALFAGFAGEDDGYVCAEHGCRCGWEWPYEPGEPMGTAWSTPLIQITAFSEDSTGNTYDALRPMIELGPLADIISHTGEELIRLPGGGEIVTVTSSHQSRLGQRATFVPQDEVGLWTAENKMVKLADAQYRNLAKMGGRASLTTNAWDPAQHSVAQREYELAAADVYRQFDEPPATLSFGDRRERRQLFRLVYPPDTLVEHDPPGHIDLASIEAETLKLLAHDPAQAERYFGNRRVAGGGVAVAPDVWDALARPHEVPPGTPVGLGFDGSINQDATFLRACTADGYSFLVGAWIRPPDAPLDWRVPRLEVHARLDWAFDRFRVGRLVADPPKWWTELDQWAAKYGAERVVALDTNQHTSRFAAACDRWLTAIAEAREAIADGREPTYRHDGDPATAEHVKAAHLRKLKPTADEADGRSRFVIVKGEDRRRIDGAVAEILALEAAMTMPAPPPTGPIFS